MSERRTVYLMGIGGIAMANVAVLLRSAGFNVTGSDQGIYEPAASILRRAGIETKTPYAESNLPHDTDTAVIVGNVQSRGHIEVEEALRRNLALESFPGFLRRNVMSGKRRVVIAGTHGKSTTSACAAHLLSTLNRDPSYLIGADPVDMEFGGKCGSGTEFVIEGDEYDSAFFDKRSKFLDYFPHVLILGRVEHDHLDIFPTLEEMLVSFRRLVAQLPSDGTLIVAADSPLALELAEKSPCKVIKVSDAPGSDYRIEGKTLLAPGGKTFTDFALGVIGAHNRLNVAMAAAGISALGIDIDDVVTAARSFHGIKRRLEKLLTSEKLIVYDDFAHHPTAIAAAISAVRDEHPGYEVVAVFEPRSNTAVRNKYQDEFRAALAHAHTAIIGTVHRKEKIPKSEVVDTNRMLAELNKQNVAAFALENSDIPEFLISRFSDSARRVILFMSNGSFGGATSDFITKLRNKTTITA